MKITLTNQEAEKFFHSALCNGLSYTSQYGLELTYADKDYNSAKKSIQRKIEKGTIKTDTICYEDVYMEILRIGKTLKMVDHENGEKDKVITMKDMYKRISDTPARHLIDMEEKKDDADTADAILQTVFYGEILFG